MTTECDICCEAFNKSKYARVDCPSCEAKICRCCTRKYLLDSKDDPHCMGCKSRWERDTFTTATLKSFVNNEWKSHHGDGLLDEEISRLPSTMSAVENYKICLNLDDQRLVLANELRELRIQQQNIDNKFSMLTQEIHTRRSSGFKTDTKKVFIKKCPGDDCKGFLSTQYKCELCELKVCPKCFTIKNRGGEDGEETKQGEHVCNEDDLKSAELIKKDTRNCPGCGTSIFQTEGCDQMWCTQCHTPFSWKTGRKIHGVIHNPHFYAWQNAGGEQAAINVPGAVMCGGLPPLYNYKVGITRALKVAFPLSPQQNLVGVVQPGGSRIGWDGSNEQKLLRRAIDIHRATTHFAQVELNRVRMRCNEAVDNEDLRIRYIMSEIDKEELKTTLLRRDTQRQKAMAILQIYELVNTIFTESIKDIYEGVVLGTEVGDETALHNIERNMNRCDSIRKYANDNLKKVSVMYNQTVRIIDVDFYTTAQKFKLVDLEN